MAAVKGELKTKQTDAKARVTLPKSFVNSLVDVEQVNEYEVRIRRVVTIPAREAWLWKNPDALESVRAGLAEAKARVFVDGPDFAADAAEFGDED